MSLLETPFKYIVRESARAKQAQLRITERFGLEVIIPKHLKGEVDIFSLLDKKQHWIQKHLPTVQKHSELSSKPLALPHQIELRGCQEIWSVRYLPSRRWDLLENPLREVTVLGDINNLIKCRKALIGWLKQKAEIYLGNLLSELSEEVQLPFRSFQIRGQQTRWGSCSSEGNISLNYQLLFFPPLLMRHILLHELAHTRYMNHGVRFWALLTRLDSQTKEHARQARRGSIYLPKWVHKFHIPPQNL